MKRKSKAPLWAWIFGGLVLFMALSNRNNFDEATTATQTATVTEQPAQTASFAEVADRYFPTSVTGNISESAGIGKVTFVQNADYFETRDKINKVMAIESARLFREVASLNQLQMTIPATDGTHSLDITRQQLEEFYGGPMSRFANLDAWRSQFLSHYDNEESRASFASKFVQVQ